VGKENFRMKMILQKTVVIYHNEVIETFSKNISSLSGGALFAP
jgi:hypothetical protein